MQTFTTILALATISTISASPISTLFARDICGTAPSGSGSQAPLQQPSNIQNAAACQSACEANGSCQSFVFGMVDNAIKCMLFSVPASSIPKQDTNLVAYDKACGSVPSVTPTSQNPTGVNQGSNNNNQQGGNNNNNNQNQGQPGHKLAVRDTCGATPAGSGSQSPLNQPANINSAADCLAQCKANPSCKSFEFGKPTPNGANVCRLFSVPAAQVPAPGSQETFQVFDVGCSV